MASERHIIRSFEDPKSTRELEDLLYPHRKALAELMHSEALRRGDVAAALELVTEVASKVLRVERASVWRFRDDRSLLECADLYERTSRKHSRGESLVAAAFPGYFSALKDERSIAASDAYSDPRTSEFREIYLRPNGISAMLDAPVFVRGKMVGVVCHEHVGAPRRWERWEELVAGSIADFVALALEAAEQNIAQNELESHRQRLEEIVTARTAELTRANADLQHEVSERARVESRLLHSEANLRSLFEVSPAVLVLTRISDQRVILANRRTAELFEVNEEEVVGQLAPDYYVNQGERATLVARVRAEGYVEGFEALLKSKSGRQFPALISAQTLTFDGAPALLVSAVDITSQKVVEERLRELATKDPLTDCLNRRHFLETASCEFERADRYQHPVSIAMLDADRFKQINDRYGHDAGDRVLRGIADRARAALRKTDSLGRFGGEEFAILFVETGLPEAEAVTNRLVNAVSELVVERDSHRIPVTISAGVAQGRKGERPESVLRRADDALYRAKEAGRNRVAADL